MKAYRVENQEKMHGIWRDFDGNVSPVFSMLTEGKCRNMPMEDSDYYSYDGKKWFSACDTKEKLRAWFSDKDIAELVELGYYVYEFEIKACRVVSEYEICFTRDNIVSQVVIDPRVVFADYIDKDVRR